MNTVNHPLERTKPSSGVVDWRSMSSGGRGVHLPTPRLYLIPYMTPSR
jgi:hypothetical protein